MAVLALVAILIAILAFRFSEQTDRGPSLLDVADWLASEQHQQLADEADRQLLYDPYPMAVAWKAADADLSRRWSALVKLATTGPGWPTPADQQHWTAGPEGLAGSENELADVLDRVPTGQLVVLGAGKTVLLLRLALDVLERRQHGDPVPIILPLTSWDPLAEDLFGWIERWLILYQPTLAAATRDKVGATAARALLEAGLIMPVLDGLDEMQGLVGGAALTQINRAVRPGQRLVLAARTTDFRAAIRSSTPPVYLAGAAAVELLPLDAGTVITYLEDSAESPEATARWAEVFSKLADGVSTPVSSVLTPPLMASLARAIYNPTPGEQLSDVARDPAELLDARLFTTRASIEEHLFDAFIPAAYRPYRSLPQVRVRRRSAGQTHEADTGGRQWTAPQVARWLRFVAQDLEYQRQGETDVEWWRLPGATPKPLASIVVGAIAFLFAAVGVTWPDLGLDLVTSVLVGLLVCRRIRKRDPAVAQRLARGFAGGVIGGGAGALLAVAQFGTGAADIRLANFVAGGLAFAFCVAPVSMFVPAVAGAFAGSVVADLYQLAPALGEVRAAIGTGVYAHLINGVGYALGAGTAVTLLGRRIPGGLFN